MTAIVKTADELRQWRADLLARLPADMDEALLFERGREWDLEPEHRTIYNTLVSIYYLLGEPEPGRSRPSSE
jgi:hypothetical protein